MDFDEIVNCPKSGGEICYRVQVTPEISNYMSLSCGFISNTLMKDGEEYKRTSGDKTFIRFQERVTKIQKQLLWDMVGPATKAELKRELFDPLIKDKTNSKLIKDGLKHVLNNYKIKD